jgi:predicted NBD/HSP70 family sugar kinase
LGGTKIEGVVMPGLDESLSEPLARIRIDTEAEKGYGHMVQRIAHLIELLKRETGLEPKVIGIGTPGSKNPQTGLMRNCNTTCLNGMPLLADLQTTLKKEVRIANDANCFALAEALWGAGRGYETVFGVIMGTGVGGGLVVNGTALEGANGIAGEWGHVVLDPGGPECYCGRRGCIETFLSGPANEREYASRAGKSLKFKEITTRADEDPEAKRQIDLLCDRFARAIAYVVNIFDPHAIILGGGVGQIEELHMSGVKKVPQWIFSDRFETPFLKPQLGDSAGVFGAALLAV